jgi:streptogramin lyase
MTLTAPPQSGVMRGAAGSIMGRYWFAALALAALAQLDPAVRVADASEARTTRAAAGVTDISAQSRRRQRRANLRVIVRPPAVRRAPQFDVFPRPYPYEWPGPNAKRDCVGWLEPESRPSGTVIVPRRRCVWVPG